jgi:hypothetical protein
MSNDSSLRKAKPRLAGRGITNRVPANKAAALLYTTGTAGANSCAPVLPALVDSAASCVSSLWRWLP